MKRRGITGGIGISTNCGEILRMFEVILMGVACYALTRSAKSAGREAVFSLKKRVSQRIERIKRICGCSRLYPYGAGGGAE